METITERVQQKSLDFSEIFNMRTQMLFGDFNYSTFSARTLAKEKFKMAVNCANIYPR